MNDITQAAKELREHLGRPGWLSSIGIGEEEGEPTIVLYLTGSVKPKVSFGDRWQGYKVVFHEFGSFAPLRGWRD